LSSNQGELKIELEVNIWCQKNSSRHLSPRLSKTPLCRESQRLLRMVIQLLQSLMRQDFRLQLKTSILIQLSFQLRSLKVQLVVGNV